MTDDIITYSGLSPEIFANKYTNEVWLWYLLRDEDAEGSGWVSNEMAIEIGTSHGMSKSRVYKILRDGEGLFWTTDKLGFRLRAVEKVAIDLGVTDVGVNVRIPREAFVRQNGEFQTFRVYLFASYFAFDKPQKMGRRTICNKFGFSLRTCYNYKHLASSVNILELGVNLAKLK